MFTGLLAWGIFCIVHFLLQKLLIDRHETYFTMQVESAADQQLLISYNKFPSYHGTQVHKFELKAGKGVQEISIPLPPAQLLRQVFITFGDEPASWHLRSIRIAGGYKPVSWDAKALRSMLKYGNESEKTNTNIQLDDQAVHVQLSRKFPLLVVTSKLTDELYNELYNSLFHISRSTALLSWAVLLLIFILVRKKWTSPSREVNFCAVFLAIVFTPLFTQKDYETSENRALAPFPDLDQNIWKLPRAYTAYYDDHFPFRNSFSRLDNAIKIRLFGVSPKPDYVKIGEDGWLFYAQQKVVNVYRQTPGYTDEELRRIANYLENIDAAFKEQDIDFYFMLTPLKHAVYPEYLPLSMRKPEGKNRREQLMAYLKAHSTLQLIDPYEVLAAQKDSVMVYYKTDTHWNKLGAFLVYQQMIKKMQKNHPQLKPLSLSQFEVEKKTSWEGDLVTLINVKNIFSGDAYHLIPKFTKKAGDARIAPSLGTEQSYLYYEADSSDAPRLLMYRDSFGEYLRMYLSENFSYSGYSWTRKLNPERIKQADPDIVVLEVFERFIDNLLPEEKEKAAQ